MLAAMGVARPAAGQTVVAGPTTTAINATPGERVTVPIGIDFTGAPGVNLGAYRLTLRWDPTLLGFAATGGSPFAAPVFNTDSTAQGVIKFAGANASGATGVFTLGSVSLDVVSTAKPDTLQLSFQELTAAGTFTNLLPVLTITSEIFCGGLIWGDLDADGVVKAVDAQIVLMHAVGLPVSADTVRGDVDANSKVDPRDALVILSKVVGLNVSAFRVGQFLVPACVVRNVASVTILPGATLALAAGDLFTATAQVRDSSGNLASGLNLAWSSSDTTVAKVDASGKITALANGTATITAAVLPGVTGAATLTVGPRHRWVVNPLLAQGQPSEVGSDIYPFSTIAQAVSRAASGDTVEIAPATYTEPLSTTKQLVFLGDSTAAGMPVISRPDSVAGVLAASGKQVIRRLKVASSGVGLTIRADTVDLSSMTLGSTNGPALKILGSKRTTLRGVTVSTAGGAGIWVDSTGGGVITIVGARVGGVGGLPAPFVSGAEYKVYAAGMLLRADSVSIDSSVVAGVMAPSNVSDTTAAFVGILTENTKRTLVRHSLVSDIAWGVNVGNGPSGLGIGADTTVTLEVRDSTTIQRVSGEGVAMRGDTIRVLATSISDAMGDAAVSAGDNFKAIDVSDVVAQRIRRGVRGKYGLRASVRRSQFLRSRGSGIVTGADTTAIDSVVVGVIDTTGYSCGVVVDSNAAVTTIDHSRIRHAGLGLGVCSREPVTTGDYAIQSVGYVAISNSVIDGPYTAVHVHADSLLIQQDSLRAVGWGIYQHSGAPRPTQWLRVRDVRIRGLLHQGIYAQGPTQLQVVGAYVDSTQQSCGGCYSSGAIEISGVGAARLDSSLVKDNHAASVWVSGVGQFTAYHDSIANSYMGYGYSSGTQPASVYVYDANHSSFRSSAVTEQTPFGLDLWLVSGDTAVVDSSSFSTWRTALRVIGAGDTTLHNRVDVAHTLFTWSRNGSASYQPSVALLTSFAGTGVLDSNTVDSTAWYGIVLQGADSLAVRGNVVSNVLGSLGASAGIAISARQYGEFSGNQVSCDGNGAPRGLYQIAGPATVIGNSVLRCGMGITVGGDSLSGAVVRANAFDGTGAAAAATQGVLVQGYGTVVVAGNAISGVNGTGITVVSNAVTQHVHSVRVDSNTVQAGVGNGIALQYADTVRVRGNTVTGLAASAGAGALRINQVFDSTIVLGNTLKGNGVTGVWLSDTVMAGLLRGNLIADDSASGMLIRSSFMGSIHADTNSIRRNRPFGVLDSSTVSGLYFQSNNFQGNLFGLKNLDTALIDARNSFWGDTLGPRCDTLLGCNRLSTGDSLSAYVTFSPFATTGIGGAPAGAPRFVSSTAFGAPPLRAMSVGAVAPAGTAPAMLPVGSEFVASDRGGEAMSRAAPLVGAGGGQPRPQLGAEAGGASGKRPIFGPGRKQ